MLPITLMHTLRQPDWILIANATRARVLQQDRGGAFVVLESFVHPVGRGLPPERLTDARQKAYTRFAHELAQHLEHEGRQGHFGALVIFAPNPFLADLRAVLGKLTEPMLTATHELDLTAVSLADLDSRISRELDLAAH
jgi:hypothetical protein